MDLNNKSEMEYFKTKLLNLSHNACNACSLSDVLPNGRMVVETRSGTFSWVLVPVFLLANFLQNVAHFPMGLPWYSTIQTQMAVSLQLTSMEEEVPKCIILRVEMSRALLEFSLFPSPLLVSVSIYRHITYHCFLTNYNTFNILNTFCTEHDDGSATRNGYVKVSCSTTDQGFTTKGDSSQPSFYEIDAIAPCSGAPAPGPPGPPGPPAPPDPECPGGSIIACMNLCPSSPPIAYKACVDVCAERCPHQFASQE